MINKTKTKPTVFLLDESNKIIAKRITVKQVFEMIDQLNNSKKITKDKLKGCIINCFDKCLFGKLQRNFLRFVFVY